MAQAGKYKEIVKIYQSKTTIDDYGEQTQDYYLEKVTRANVLWNSGQRTSENSQIWFPNIFTLIVHRYINIKDDTHIELQGKMYRVIEYHTDRQHNDIVVKIELITT